MDIKAWRFEYKDGKEAVVWIQARIMKDMLDKKIESMRFIIKNGKAFFFASDRKKNIKMIFKEYDISSLDNVTNGTFSVNIFMNDRNKILRLVETMNGDDYIYLYFTEMGIKNSVFFGCDVVPTPSVLNRRLDATYVWWEAEE